MLIHPQENEDNTEENPTPQLIRPLNFKENELDDKDKLTLGSNDN
jgi:hypothetical protein